LVGSTTNQIGRNWRQLDKKGSTDQGNRSDKPFSRFFKLQLVRVMRIFMLFASSAPSNPGFCFFKSAIVEREGEKEKKLPATEKGRKKYNVI
jgi:hypothetical protein